MKKITTGLFGLVVSVSAIAQTDPGKYATEISADALKQQLTIIASAEMEGRATGTEGQRKAAAYIASEFKRIGLQQVQGTENYQQRYPLFFDSIVDVALRVGDRSWSYGTDFQVPPQINMSNKFKAKEIVVAGYGITEAAYDDYAGKKVKEKIVMIFSGEPKVDGKYVVTGTDRPSNWSHPSQGLAAKTEAALKQGAKGVIFVSPSLQSFNTPAGGGRRTNIFYPQPEKTNRLNVVSVSHAAAADILGKTVFESLLSGVKQGSRLNDRNISVKKKTRFAFKKDRKEVPATNVIGFVEGTDKKDEYVILSAHYDHIGRQGDKIFYGADDDGSGTSAIIKIGEAFAKAKAEGNGPRRSIVMLAVSGEENGLLGSRYYAENPLLPLNKTSVNLNTDMIGRIDPERKYGDSLNYIYIIGDDKLSSDLTPILNEVNKQYVNMELDRKFNDLNDRNRFYYRSDHYNFAKNGVPVIFYFNGTHADYHRATDTVDKINFPLMAKRAQLIYYTAWQMANIDKMVKRDIPLPESAFNR